MLDQTALFVMHIPKLFQFQEDVEKVAFMKRYSFATIITAKDGVRIATHLPFFVDDSGEKLVLNSHFGIANEQVIYIVSASHSSYLANRMRISHLPITISQRVYLPGITSRFTPMALVSCFSMRNPNIES